MSLTFDNNMHGLYRTEILRADGTTRWDSGLHPNLITDHGLNQMAYSTGSFAYECYVGTGTTPPTPTDNKLQAPALTASTSGKVTTYDKQLTTSPYYAWMQNVWTFAAATQNVTLGEMGTGSSPDKLVTRSLLKDSNGAPTTVTLLVGEVLRVTHVLRNYFDLGETTGVLEVGGVTYNYSARGIAFRDTGQWRLRDGWAFPDVIACGSLPVDAKWVNVDTLDQAISVNPTIKSFSPQSNPPPPNPSPGVTRWVAPFGVNDANFPLGIRWFDIRHTSSNSRSGVTYGILLDKAIPKTDKHQLTLTIDMIYKRYTP